MASLEQLQALGQDMTTTDDDSTSEEEDVGTSGEELAPGLPPPAAATLGNEPMDTEPSASPPSPPPPPQPPKAKLKLKLRMPTKAPAAPVQSMEEVVDDSKRTEVAMETEATPPSPPSSTASIVKEKDDVIMEVQAEPVDEPTSAPVPVEATVVDDDAVEDTTNVAIVVPEKSPSNPKSTSNKAPLADPVTSSGRATNRTTSSNNATTKKRQSVRPIKLPAIASPGLLLANGTTTAQIFEANMKMAGYSLEARVDNPHRGSSTRRQVGDIFDSDVLLWNNFPKLVPEDLLPMKKEEQDGCVIKTGSDAASQEEEAEETPKLIQILHKVMKKPEPANGGGLRKGRFQQMMPLSLQIDYPSDHVVEQQDYVRRVKQREAAIVSAQLAEMDDKPVVPIPDLPEPPEPPKLIAHQQGFDLQDKYPFYPPKHDDFVKHLDPNCFHASTGRYVGLSTNSISDPHFCGPHALGIANLTVTAGTGLATTQTGSTSAGSASLASTVYGDRKESASANRTQEKTKKAKIPKIKKESISPGTKKRKLLTSPTAGTAVNLKRIMDAGDEETDKMRNCIIRAAVYASRTGKHGLSFLGPDRRSHYQDISKTFAAYAGVKPCPRCKNNKQGAYHCRLKRRHKDLDHDGTDSVSKLTPLFDEPLESLILRKKKKKKMLVDGKVVSVSADATDEAKKQKDGAGAPTTATPADATKETSGQSNVTPVGATHTTAATDQVMPASGEEKASNSVDQTKGEAIAGTY